jgi:hypothetical protein
VFNVDMLVYTVVADGWKINNWQTTGGVYSGRANKSNTIKFLKKYIMKYILCQFMRKLHTFYLVLSNKNLNFLTKDW